LSARTKFEGREVVGVEVTVRGATADLPGASAFRIGQIVYLVCEAVVDKISHKPVKDSDKLVRVEGAAAVVAAVVDKSLVDEALELARIQAEAQAGIQRLGFDDQAE
jgi:hypothetical protein